MHKLDDFSLLFVLATDSVLNWRTSTMVVLAALHMGWLKFLAVFLSKRNACLNYQETLAVITP